VLLDDGLPDVREDGIGERDVHKDLLCIEYLACIWSCRNIAVIEYVVRGILTGACLNTAIPGFSCLVTVKLGVTSGISLVLLPFRQQCSMLVEHFDGMS
jgi:hypothetical protein